MLTKRIVGRSAASAIASASRSFFSGWNKADAALLRGGGGGVLGA